MKNILNKRLIVFILAILLLLIVFFATDRCKFRKYREYNYKRVNTEQSGVEVWARLIGTYKYPKYECILTSPYILSVWFSSDKPIEGYVRITQVKLYDKKRGIVVLNETDAEASTFGPVYDGSTRARLAFENLNIDYLDYSIFIRYVINISGQPPIEDEIEMHFRKDYREYWSNDIVDGIMGI